MYKDIKKFSDMSFYEAICNFSHLLEVVYLGIPNNTEAKIDCLKNIMEITHVSAYGEKLNLEDELDLLEYTYIASRVDPKG